jgi:hypothetical protein
LKNKLPQITATKMTDQTTENFWKAWTEPWPEPPPVFYRLYYNADGTPVCYTMEDLPGTYIEIDQATYAQSLPNVRVVNGKITVIKRSDTVNKLQPSDTGTPCSPHDVCVVVTEDQSHIYWSTKIHEIN